MKELERPKPCDARAVPRNPFVAIPSRHKTAQFPLTDPNREGIEINVRQLYP